MASTALRRLGIVAAAVLGFLILASAAVYGVSSSRMSRVYVVKPETFNISDDSATIERGHHLVTAIGKCVECHGENFEGRVMDMGPVGQLAPPNLTRGAGGVGNRSDAEWSRAIRHGLRADGRPLIFMPSTVFAAMDAGDLAAVIAYLKQLPPVDHTVPASKLGPIGRLIIVTKPGRMLQAEAIDHEAAVPSGVPHQPSVEYGHYLMVTGGCTYCHGDGLRGGIKEGPPGTPPSVDLTPHGPLANWTEDDFRQALRTGLRPDNTVINPFMPWALTRLMTDDEIKAVWLYLRTL